MYRGHLCLVFEHGRLERDDYSLHPGEFQADDFSLHLFLVGYYGDIFLTHNRFMAFVLGLISFRKADRQF